MSGHYRIYGLTVGCDFPLPAARPISEQEALVGEGRGPVDLQISWIAASTPGQTTRAPEPRGEPVLSQCPDGGMRLVWPGEITADISGDGRRIALQTRPEKLIYLPTLTIGILLGIALHLRGILCLHGSALEIDGRVVSFMGDSGAGKSTLAAWLLRQGARLYVDDLVAIMPDVSGMPVVPPGPTGLRLTAEAAEALFAGTVGMERIPYLGKYLWDLARPDAPCQGQYGDTPHALSALYWLEPAMPGKGARVSAPLPAVAALAKLVEALYPPQMRQMLTRIGLEKMAGLVERVPVHVVHYERSWAHLPFFDRMLLSQ